MCFRRKFLKVGQTSLLFILSIDCHSIDEFVVQSVWNNDLFLIDNQWIHLRQLYNRCIHCVDDFLEDSEFFSYDTFLGQRYNFCQRYNLTINFLTYFGIVNSIGKVAHKFSLKLNLVQIPL